MLLEASGRFRLFWSTAEADVTNATSLDMGMGEGKRDTQSPPDKIPQSRWEHPGLGVAVGHAVRGADRVAQDRPDAVLDLDRRPERDVPLGLGRTVAG